MDPLELPLMRECSCGELLMLLHAVPDPDMETPYYYTALEGGVEQMVLWAETAVASVYAASAGEVAAYHETGAPPVHDLLALDGQVICAGDHRPPGVPYDAVAASAYAAYLFGVTQADAKIAREGITDPAAMAQVHAAMQQAVQAAIARMQGTS